MDKIIVWCQNYLTLEALQKYKHWQNFWFCRDRERERERESQRERALQKYKHWQNFLFWERERETWALNYISVPLFQTVFNASNIKEVCRVQPQSIEIFRKVSESWQVGISVPFEYIYSCHWLPLDEPFWTNWLHTLINVNWSCDVAVSGR